MEKPKNLEKRNQKIQNQNRNWVNTKKIREIWSSKAYVGIK